MGEKELGYSSCVNVLVAGEIITPFVSSWSTITMTELNLWESGNPMMRLMDIEEKRRGDLTARGDSLGIMGWVFTFAVWQSALNFHRNVDIPGHQ